MDLLAFRSISFLCISHSAPFPTSPCICFYITDCFGWLASGRWELRKYTHNRPSGDFQRSLLQFVVHSSSSWKSSHSIPRSCTKVFLCGLFLFFAASAVAAAEAAVEAADDAAAAEAALQYLQDAGIRTQDSATADRCATTLKHTFSEPTLRHNPSY